VDLNSKIEIRNQNGDSAANAQTAAKRGRIEAGSGRPNVPPPNRATKNYGEARLKRSENPSDVDALLDPSRANREAFGLYNKTDVPQISGEMED